MSDTPDLPESREEEGEQKSPKLWGFFYFILGITGLAFSIYTLINSFGMVPLYGTATASLLIGALSILFVFYGYRVIKRDY